MIKISEDDKIKMVDKFLSGIIVKDLCKEFKISDKTISKIIKNEIGATNLSDLRLKNKKSLVNDSQKQIIYGSLLGDASLSKRYSKNNFVNYCFTTSHCLAQKDFLIQQANILQVTPHSYIKSENSWSPGSEYWKLNYFNKLFLEEVYNKCFIDNRKSVTESWLNEISWEGIANWFMDDGCSYKYINAKTVQVNFSTLSFIESEINLLIQKFYNLMVKSHVVKSQHGNGLILTINSESVNYFMDQISPYMSDCMRYKIKKDIKQWIK